MADPQQDRNLTIILGVISAALVAKYGATAAALIGKFAKLIATYSVGDLLLLQMRKTAAATVAELTASVPQIVEQVIASAVADGADAAGPGEPINPLRGYTGDTFESHAERSARAIREDLEGKLNGLNYRITRFADDIYQTVVTDAAQAQTLGLTPAEAQHQAYEQLVKRGIDGFTDSKGRKWELQAYVEMAVRTATQRAYNVSHLDRMLSLGVELFTVTDDGHPCPLCLPWQGQVLSVEPDNRANATITEATAAGLFHVNCRHTLVAFFPDVTDLPASHEWTAADQAAYVESQEQRRLEREIRAAKRLLEGAFTPEMKSQAQFGVRRAQANMRAFIDRTDRVRVSRREQITL